MGKGHHIHPLSMPSLPMMLAKVRSPERMIQCDVERLRKTLENSGTSTAYCCDPPTPRRRCA